MELTINNIAKLTGLSLKTIRREVAAGNLKASKAEGHYSIEWGDYLFWKNNYYANNHEETTSSTKKDKDCVNWIDISSNWHRDGWNNPSQRNGYNFIDLFSGAGGLSCGLVMAGFNPIGTVEIMPEAVETYKNNFCVTKGFSENVRTKDIREPSVKAELYESVKGKKIDLIVGGFPCQGFSMAGNRVVTDPRNSLYLEMLEIVKNLQPDYVVMENVEGLRTMLNGQVEKKIISDYKEAGYDINVTVLNAADYYVPQTRKRVIFVGNRHGLLNYHPKAMLSQENYVTLGEGVQRFMEMPENKSINHVFTRHSEKMKQAIIDLPEGKSLYKEYSDAWKKSPWDKPSCTIKENHGGVNIHPKLPRVLTARELAALQSFPDDFIFYGSKKWQLVQIGNAVPPLLGKAIGLAVEEGLNSLHKKGR